MKFLKFFVETICWLQVFAAPTVVFLVAGFILKLYLKATTGNIAFGCMVTIGVILGCLWAEQVRRKHGCANFMGRLYSGGSGRDAGKN
jgi:hypothetical protein